jgi:hypothetical protein
MIIQQGAALDPLVVAVIAASAGLGQSSYFLATAPLRTGSAGIRPRHGVSVTPGVRAEDDLAAGPTPTPTAAACRRS